MVYEFIHELQWRDLPSAVMDQAQRCVLDLCGVAAAGRSTAMAQIIRGHAVDHFGAGRTSARLLFDGRPVSPVGAALAGAVSIDSIDAHDGFNPAKGHAGVALLPALLAYTDAGYDVDGRGFLTAVALGYEIACRAALALHGSAAQYHTSGAWHALAVAALGARLLKLDRAATREALGIAEYHAPRSPMMRCIVYPTMVKDGAWGAMAGVSAAYLAATGFTGAPAELVESESTAQYWRDLGQRWLILEQYFKPYPVCRWVQPAVAAALSLARAHRLKSSSIERIEVTSFHEAVCLNVREPADTEQAQYSLPFAVGIALSRGRLSAAEVTGTALAEPEALRLSRGMRLRQADEFNTVFPHRRRARVRLLLADGRRLDSPVSEARGDPGDPLSDDELLAKFESLASITLAPPRRAAIRDAVVTLTAQTDSAKLRTALLMEPS